jgi:hypothetical protein
MGRAILVKVLLLAVFVPVASADFGGSIRATRALSPDGNVIVRVTLAKPAAKGEPASQNEVIYYHFDETSNTYVKRSQFNLSAYHAQMLYVSNAGDLLLISLGTKDAIRLLAKDGKLVKTWSLGDFLSPAEIKACAETGSTLQWLEEGAFYERQFYFRGPSRTVRAVSPPYTVMRGVDEKVTFSGTINAKDATLSKDEDERP